ncbi:MAG TPA: hypothetical protein VJ933_07115 [Phaeodactylibacter sp.]|nr:hypothetical protein [Phaeodactylibacter sp.]
MKTFHFTLVLLLSLSLQAHSQTSDSTSWREMGLRLSGVDNLDFIYKKQLGENRYKRIRLLFSDLQFRRLNDTNLFNASLGGALGWEKRRTIAEKVQFLHGWEPFLNLSFNSTNDRFGLNTILGVGYVLGFQLTVSEQFYVALETIPSLSINLNAGEAASDAVAVGAGFNSNAVALTLVYRFQATKP